MSGMCSHVRQSHSWSAVSAHGWRGKAATACRMRAQVAQRGVWTGRVEVGACEAYDAAFPPSQLASMGTTQPHHAAAVSAHDRRGPGDASGAADDATVPPGAPVGGTGLQQAGVSTSSLGRQSRVDSSQYVRHSTEGEFEVRACVLRRGWCSGHQQLLAAAPTVRIYRTAAATRRWHWALACTNLGNATNTRCTRAAAGDDRIPLARGQHGAQRGRSSHQRRPDHAGHGRHILPRVRAGHGAAFRAAPRALQREQRPPHALRAPGQPQAKWWAAQPPRELCV